MAHYQNQYGAVPQTDEYGNPIRQTDEAGYGSYQTGHTTTGGLGTGTGITTGHHEREHHGLHCDDGSSSSSSEDERTGRKKGTKEKIKEKIPGIRHKDDRPQHADSTTTPGGPGRYGISGEGQYRHEHGHEKKGVVDKIKEKLPGHHGH